MSYPKILLGQILLYYANKKDTFQIIFEGQQSNEYVEVSTDSPLLIPFYSNIITDISICEGEYGNEYLRLTLGAPEN